MKLIGVIFRGSLLGAHRRGHPILPGLPDASPHHRQPAVSGTTTSRGRVRDGGLDLHHHLHLHHPPLHHPPPPPPPVVSGAAKLVKRAVITSDTQELSHADANCGQECFFCDLTHCQSNKRSSCGKNNKNGSCSFEEVLFTAHYNDISRELRINEQQINKKAESESETCPNATNALISCCSQSS